MGIDNGRNTSKIPHVMTLADWLAEEPFTLTMSSGFFGFFAHTGMLEALVERGLRPTRITGSSAGALVGGVYGAGWEPADIARALMAIRRADFWDPRPGLGILRGGRFRGQLVKLVGDKGIEDCRVPLALVVHDVLGHRAVAMDRGPLATIIHASCAVPIMFHPVWIAGRPYVDGGVLDRPGITPLAPGERALIHHLESRSPWRAALTVPQRDNAKTLVLGELPRSGPFQLDAGHRAYDVAKSRMRVRLDEPA